jgi:AhpD family alkylhydroperoxidase
LELEERAFTSGALSRKTKELIATGISVSMDCATCMEWHISACAAAGATSHEVLEAIEVGMVLGGGRATVAGRVALLVLEDVFDGDG